MLTSDRLSASGPTEDLLEWADERRGAASAALDPTRQRTFAQYFTPLSIAKLMASMLPVAGRARWHVLDPGAGIGTLSAAVIERICLATPSPTSIHVTAYEIDERLLPTLADVLAHCAAWAADRGVLVTSEVRGVDFLLDASGGLAQGAPDPRATQYEPYEVAILNPPYGKIGSKSEARRAASQFGVDTPNRYAAFWATAAWMTAERGHVIAITPRSFCNGTYFRDFRRFLLSMGALRRLHVFDARDAAFADDGVLQENVITHLERGAVSTSVVVTAQASPDAPVRERTVAADRVVHPADPERFIHVVPDAQADAAAAFMAALPKSLGDLGLRASTGPVVDFRASDLLRIGRLDGTVPLIYPVHVRGGWVQWPLPEDRSASSIIETTANDRKLLVPDGNYVVVRRFSAKEERRRVVAGLLEKGSLGVQLLGLENHVNYIHANGRSIDRDVAIGLVVYLNSHHVDDYFRQFSGHTQVNATDLRSLPFPSLDVLRRLGSCADMQRLADPAYYDEASVES